MHYLLDDGTVGTAPVKVSVGDTVTVSLHDENGLPIRRSGVVAEILADGMTYESIQSEINDLKIDANESEMEVLDRLHDHLILAGSASWSELRNVLDNFDQDTGFFESVRSIQDSIVDFFSPRQHTHNMKFIKYMGRAHLNSRNIAMYVDGRITVLVAEDIQTDAAFGSKAFFSQEVAQDWFDELGTTNIQSLAIALEQLQ